MVSCAWFPFFRFSSSASTVIPDWPASSHYVSSPSPPSKASAQSKIVLSERYTIAPELDDDVLIRSIHAITLPIDRPVIAYYKDHDKLMPRITERAVDELDGCDIMSSKQPPPPQHHFLQWRDGNRRRVGPASFAESCKGFLRDFASRRSGNRKVFVGSRY